MDHLSQNSALRVFCSKQGVVPLLGDVFESQFVCLYSHSSCFIKDLRVPHSKRLIEHYQNGQRINIHSQEWSGAWERRQLDQTPGAGVCISSLLTSLPCWHPGLGHHCGEAVQGLVLCLVATLASTWGFLGGSEVKNLPAMQETWVWSPSQEDPLV